MKVKREFPELEIKQPSKACHYWKSQKIEEFS
jgi:hypothetical protein